MEWKFLLPLTVSLWRLSQYALEPPMVLFYGEIVLWAILRLGGVVEYARQSHRFLFYSHVMGYQMWESASPKTWLWWMYATCCQCFDIGIPAMQLLNEVLAFDSCYRDYWTYEQSQVNLLSNEWRGCQ